METQSNFSVLTEKDAQSLLISAFEGGSNYWYWLENDEEMRAATSEMKGQPLVDRIWDFIWNKGGSQPINDAEDNQEVLGHLTREGLVRAEALMLKDHRPHFANILSENDDAETGDVFLQLAVLGELTYG